MSDERNHNWKYLLPFSKRNRCLFLGEPEENTVKSLSDLFESFVVAGTKTDNVNDTNLEKMQLEESSADVVILCLDDTALREDQKNSVLGEVFRVLSPGGFLCIRGEKRRGEDIGFLRKKLAGSDYENVKTFAHLPGHGQLRIIIPLTFKPVLLEALRLYHDVTMKQRLLRSVASILILSGLFERVITDFSLIAQKPSHDGSQKEKDELKEFLKNSVKTDNIEVALRSASAGKGSKAILQVMEPAEGRTLAFVKVADNEHRGKFIEHEYNTLMKLGNYGFVHGVYPEVIDYKQFDGLYSLVLAAPVFLYKQPSTRIDESILDWLIELNSRTSSRKLLPESGFYKTLVENAETLLSKPPFSKKAWVLEMIEDVTRSLEGRLIPFGMAHRDFVAWNVRTCNDGKLYVMDWEWARDDHIPFMDFFHYVLHGELNLGKGGIFDIAERLFFRKSYLTKYIYDYCKALQLEPSDSFQFFLLYLIDWVLFEMQNSPEGTLLSEDHWALLRKIFHEKQHYRENWPLHGCG